MQFESVVLLFVISNDNIQIFVCNEIAYFAMSEKCLKLDIRNTSKQLFDYFIATEFVKISASTVLVKKLLFLE